MPKILVLGEQPQFRALLSESLWFDAHRVESVADAALLWEHLDLSVPMLCSWRQADSFTLKARKS
jgi:hypothetical protein